MPDAPVGMVRLVAKPNPFSVARIERRVPAGSTVAEYLRLTGIRPAVLDSLSDWIAVDIGDWDGRAEPARVPPDMWPHVRPNPGTAVVVRTFPGIGGGGGGGKKKSPFGMIAAIASIALSFAFPLAAGPTLFSFGNVSIGLYGALARVGGFLLTQMAGGMAGAVAPTPQAGITQRAAPQSRTSPTLSITGTNNRLPRWSPIIRIHGRHRVFPPYAAVPFTELEGSDEYVRMLFSFGYGPVSISDIRLGETPLDQFDGVETEIREGWDSDTPITLYSNDVAQDQYELHLTSTGGAQILESKDAADEIIIDLTFRGLVAFNAQGNRSNHSVAVKVEYRLAGSADPWVTAFNGSYTAATDQSYRRGIRFVPAVVGRYEIQFTRLTADNSVTTIRDDLYITAIRTVRYVAPTDFPGEALLALRIKATDQLNGSPDDVNAIAEAWIDVWDGASFTKTKTRDYAWCALDLLRGPANGKPIPDARIDLASFKAAADENAAAGAAMSDPDGLKWTFDAVHDSATTVFEAFSEVASAGRASLAMPDGLFGIVRDRAQSVPAQFFSPRNSWGFRGLKAFGPEVHAIRARYIEPGLDWSQQEVIVYADGYDENSATEFEVLESFGVTRREQAHRETRFHWAQAIHRPEIFEFSADIEALIATRGDLVVFSHDVPSIGLGWARIKSLTLDGGGDVTAITLDDVVVMEAGKTYGLRIRRADTTDLTVTVTTAEGESADVTPATPIAAIDAPAEDDLVMFGETATESIDCILTRIESGPNLTAKLTLVHAAPAVHTADTGTVPPFDPVISFPVDFTRIQPPVPELVAIRSDEGAIRVASDGTLVPRIGIEVAPVVGAYQIGHMEARWRIRDSGDAWGSGTHLADETEMFLEPVVTGENYEIRARWVTIHGTPSPYATFPDHVVVGKTGLPPDLSAIYDEGGDLRFEADLPVDFEGFLVRYHQGQRDTWETALPAHSGVWTDTLFPKTRLPTGPVTVLVKLQDTSGNQSANAFIAEVNRSVEALDNVVITADYRAMGFPGTITGGAVESGDLKATALAGDLFWPTNDNALFWQPDDDDVFWDDRFEQLQYLFTLQPGTGMAGARLTFSMAIDADAWSLEYRPSSQEPFWPTNDTDPFWPAADGDPFWPEDPDFQPWPGTLIVEETPYNFRLTTSSGTVRGCVTALVASLDVPDVVQTFANFAVTTPSIRIPLAKDFFAITAVVVTFQSAAAGVRVEVLDFDATQGPEVRARDGDDNDTSATINGAIYGWRKAS